MSSTSVIQKTQRITDISTTEESDSSISSLQVVHNLEFQNPVLPETSDVDDILARAGTANGIESGSLPTIYNAIDIAPLIGLAGWDKVKTQVNIALRGPQVIQGLCDEAEFVRSYLPKTRSSILQKTVQTESSLFCIREMCSVHIGEDVRLAFANLLPESLFYAERSQDLIASIEALRTLHAKICPNLPLYTLNVIMNWQLHVHNNVEMTSTQNKSVTGRRTSNKPNLWPPSLNVSRKTSTRIEIPSSASTHYTCSGLTDTSSKQPDISLPKTPGNPSTFNRIRPLSNLFQALGNTGSNKSGDL